jgi:ribosomal-protein-alanine N-acetyltransferase
MMENIVEVSKFHAGIISVMHEACFEETWNEKSVSKILNMAGTIGLITGAEKERPQAFILLRVAADEAEIISIGVIPTARKKGLASTLLLEAIKRAAIRNAKKMFFEVAHDNTGARALYEKFEFQIVGKRPKYYTRLLKKVDAVIYKLNISDMDISALAYK